MDKRKWMTAITGGIAGTALAASTVLGAVQNDLRLNASSLELGSANGFVGKGTYKNGARVYVYASAEFSQDCVKLQETGPAKDRRVKRLERTEQALIDTTKDVSYVDRRNSKDKLTGHTWVAPSFAIPAPLDLCSEGNSGWQPEGQVQLVNRSGRAYLSADGGVSTMSDSLTGAPIETPLAQ